MLPLLPADANKSYYIKQEDPKTGTIEYLLKEHCAIKFGRISLICLAILCTAIIPTLIGLCISDDFKEGLRDRLRWDRKYSDPDKSIQKVFSSFQQQIGVSSIVSAQSSKVNKPSAQTVTTSPKAQQTPPAIQPQTPKEEARENPVEQAPQQSEVNLVAQKTLTEPPLSPQPKQEEGQVTSPQAVPSPNTTGSSATVVGPLFDTPESTMLREYRSKLTATVTTKQLDQNTLQLDFTEFPAFLITIRGQDIFESGAEVIINAANTPLVIGGGIDKEIGDKGGPSYKAQHEALRKKYKGKYVPGYATMVESGALKTTYGIDHVIIVAGPTNEKEKGALYSCYYNSLLLAHRAGKKSIAFPAVSTGIFGFPRDLAASISLQAIQDFITDYPDATNKIISIHFYTNDKACFSEYTKAATSPLISS